MTKNKKNRRDEDSFTSEDSQNIGSEGGQSRKRNNNQTRDNQDTFEDMRDENDQDLM